MQFQEVIGQETVKAELKKLVLSGRMPHAILLAGSPGSGNLALALALSQYLLCTHRTPDDACGSCPGCQKAAKLIHPDLHFTMPSVGSKATSDEFMPAWRLAMAENPYLNVYQWLQKIGEEGKQGNITKDECVNIVRKLSLKCFEGAYKIMVIWMPEYLGNEGNRLLKILEEPPESTIFVLVAEDLDKILPTILSRSQILKVSALNDEEITQALQQRSGLAPTRALSVAHLADGNFNEALQIVELSQKEEEANAGRSGMFLEWMRKCYAGNGVEMAKWVEGFAGIGRENQKFFLQYGLHFMREFLQQSSTEGMRLRLLPEELETARRMSKVIGFEQVEKITRLFSDCAYHVERNANPKILFLDASIRLHRILKNVA
jgi:DNA polymerase-3 subunit delta'